RHSTKRQSSGFQAALSMSETPGANMQKLGRLGLIWLYCLIGVIVCDFGLALFDNTTELTPSHENLLLVCFIAAGAAGVLSAGVGIWQSATMPVWRRVGGTVGFALLGALGTFLLLTRVTDIATGVVDFPPDKTKTFQTMLLIS